MGREIGLGDFQLFYADISFQRDSLDQSSNIKAEGFGDGHRFDIEKQGAVD